MFVDEQNMCEFHVISSYLLHINKFLQARNRDNYQIISNSQ